MTYGPTLPISESTHASKYRGEGESFEDGATRNAWSMSDDAKHFELFRPIVLNMRFMAAGRVQAAMGSPRHVTPYNCFVSETIVDSIEGIMRAATNAAHTMRLGGGIGYDFSTLRPRGDRIVSLDSRASGPVSFMEIFNSVCKTIASAGNRRGAQMAVLRVDHPDIQEFVHAKQVLGALEEFNISVAVTDEFMEAVRDDAMFELKFEGVSYGKINARNLWEDIMRSTWDWAEPGVLFIDRINQMNNLWYCEDLAATNPCGEQPLPPDGACLLGSFNLVKYLKTTVEGTVEGFDWDAFKADIPPVVRAMDNVVDRAVYPLPAQELEAHNKRRMGLGVTAAANAGEILGYPYGSEAFLEWLEKVLETLKNESYRASAMLAKEKGPFPLYDKVQFKKGRFFKGLDEYVQSLISRYGLRNSHLTSIAPTGTISLSADNVSSGIEPAFALEATRVIQGAHGPVIVEVQDYAYRVYGVKGKVSSELDAQEHLAVLAVAQKHVDSAVSKTCNVSPDMEWEAFKSIYYNAWEMGCKGITTYNPGGKRAGILVATNTEDEDAACWINPDGSKSCE